MPSRNGVPGRLAADACLFCFGGDVVRNPFCHNSSQIDVYTANMCAVVQMDGGHGITARTGRSGGGPPHTCVQTAALISANCVLITKTGCLNGPFILGGVFQIEISQTDEARRAPEKRGKHDVGVVLEGTAT
jgi:hypothetical protein